MSRPKTTLFILMSVDGKINSGDSDDLDFDRDLKRIAEVKEGLHQYDDLEKMTDLVSFNTGRSTSSRWANRSSLSCGCTGACWWCNNTDAYRW